MRAQRRVAGYHPGMTRIASALLLAALCPALSRGADSPALEMARQLNQAFVEVAEKVSPSVVVIKVAQAPRASAFDDSDNPFWDLVPKEFRRQFEEEREKRRRDQADPDTRPGRPPVFDGQGSGVIIRDDGYIMTNFHVVEDAEKIKVRLRDGRTFIATVRGGDPQSDIAVIKIAATNLPVARLGNSAALKVGEFVAAIGAPFDLDYSVTYGHVSAKGRTHVIPAMGANSQGAIMDQDFIQTDASINPGNSGGPLVNLYHEVVGINTLIRGLHTGIGFAVPVDLAREVADQLIEDGKFSRAWLGVGIRGLRRDEDYTELTSDVTEGVIVTQLQPNGPASRSDLKPGDIITAVEGRTVATETQLRNEVRGKKPGRPITLDVLRGDRPLKIKVHPELWPEKTEMAAARRKATKASESAAGFGISVESINGELAERFGLESREGVVVTKVERGSIAASKRIAVGDVITAINQRPITSLTQFREAVKELNLKQGVIIDFMSKGAQKFEVLKESGD
jgi:serine protease Do